MRHLLLLVFMILPVASWCADDASLEIEDPWIRETPPGISPMAGYMKLTNNGSETIVLEAISSRDFKRIELHQTRIEGEMARMESKDDLTLAPDQTVKLEPGGYHLKLFNPARQLRAGDQVLLILTFKDKSSQTVEAEIRTDQGDTTSHHQYH